MVKTIGIGEYKVCRHPDDILKTYGLGSCVAVIVYDRVNFIAGMIHVGYPESSVNSQRAERMPGYFVDTGVPLLIEEMKKHNVVKRNLWVKLVGGAAIMDENERFNIGKRNILAVKKVLWKAGVGVLKEDTGGVISRTVSIAVRTGEVIISNGSKQWEL